MTHASGNGHNAISNNGNGDGDGHEPASPASHEPPVDVWVGPPSDGGWLRRLLPLLRTHRARIIASLATAVVAMGIGVTVPLVLRAAIDGALDEQTRDLEPLVITLVVLGVIRAVLTFFYRYGLYSTAFRLEFQMRTILQEHLSRQSFAFFDRVQSGQIISRANSDIRSIQLFLAFVPLMAVQFLSFIAALIIMLRIDAVLTLIALTPMPLVFVLGRRLRNLFFPQSWIVQSRQAEIATVVDESVNGVRVVKSFAAERRQILSLARAAERLRWANLQQHRARADHNPIIENLPRLGLALVLLWGGLGVIDGNLTIGDLVAFNVYIVVLQAPFRFLGMVLMMGQRAKASAERIYEVLDEPITLFDRPGAVDLVDPVGRVVFADVGFAYGTESIGGTEASRGTSVLDGFDLVIEPGETVAVVGATGSGKSTIPRLLLRFYETQTGSVSVDGHDVRDLTGSSLRAAVGMVPDEPFLFSTTVHDNIAYGRPSVSRDDVIAAATAAHAHDFICELEHGYDTVVGERGYDLSGGQRQRIAIARTLLTDPAVLVLDDATSAIDVHVEAQIHDALADLLGQRTTLIIAHRLSTIALADRVVVLDAGRLIADGTHAELLATVPRYAEILDSGDSTAETGAAAPDAHATAQEVR